MNRRNETVQEFYNRYSEDDRLTRSRHGQLEYLTTMHYIHRHAPENARILEIGAGTGRYSIALAKEGYDVTAVELVERNVEILRENGKGIANLRACEGDAVDLSCFPDDSFDVTLVLGPMYHLYEAADQHQALDEAIRVTKPGGVLMAAFLSVDAIIFCDYLNGNLLAGLEENFTEDYRTRHFTEQLFTGFDIREFEALFQGKPVSHLTTAATDSILEMVSDRRSFSMSDEEFAAYADYHLNTCEKRELLGSSSHLLYICQKQNRL